MKAGELSELVDVMDLRRDGDVFAWGRRERVWAKVEQLKRHNVYSATGRAAKSFGFTIRKCDLSLHNAIMRTGRHYFLTDINGDGREYLEVIAALVTPKVCTVRRGNIARNSLNRTAPDAGETLIFPACLTEKYLRHIELEPMNELELRYVLVTPKAIELAEGQLVEIDGVMYAVLLCHTLDEYKNEYELLRRKDVDAKR